jgi:hypothetical protein
MEVCGILDAWVDCEDLAMTFSRSLPGFAAAVLTVFTCSISSAQFNNPTPQQMQGMINMRALQMRGGGQVRTGYPQDIQFGAPTQQNYSQVEDQANQDRKASTQKRIEARKALEEKKKAARDEAKAKKAKAGGKAKDELANAKDAKKGHGAKSVKSTKPLDPANAVQDATKPAGVETAK